MGAHCSIHNDTLDETVMVFVGVNTKVLQPLLYAITGAATLLSGGVAMGSVAPILTLGGGSTATAATVAAAGEVALLTLSIPVATITAAAGGIVSASNYCLDKFQTQLVTDLTKGGYHTCLPGQTYTSSAVTPALNLRAWLVRIQRTPQAIIIKRCSGSVWSGRKPGQHSLYRVLDKSVFRQWTKHHGSIPMPMEHNDVYESKMGNTDGVVGSSSGDCKTVDDGNSNSGTAPLHKLEGNDDKRIGRNDGNTTSHHDPILATTLPQNSATTTKQTPPQHLKDVSESATIVKGQSQHHHADIGSSHSHSHSDMVDEASFTFLDSGMTNCKCILVKDDENQNDRDAWIQIN